jgi:hypothetical protein
MRTAALSLTLLLGCSGDSNDIKETLPAPQTPLGPCEVERLTDEACTGFPTN